MKKLFHALALSGVAIFAPTTSAFAEQLDPTVQRMLLHGSACYSPTHRFRLQFSSLSVGRNKLLLSFYDKNKLASVRPLKVFGSRELKFIDRGRFINFNGNNAILTIPRKNIRLVYACS